MSDYIKREDALDIILKYFPRSAKKLNIYREINNLPAADVAEVRPMYYRTCPDCGAHLDPGERCDCRDAKSAAPGSTSPVGGKAKNTHLL